MNFFKYIKAVGTGPKSNRDLTKEEIKEAIEGILEQKCESEQAAAFLMLLRVKLESDDELKGCLQTFDKYIKRESLPQSVELGYSYDGKSNQPYLFPLYAPILNDFFSRYKDIEPFDIVISGDELQPAKNGVTVKELATAVKLDKRIHFFDRKEYFSELSALTSLRKKLYMRTIFNTVEKLLNPANSKYALTSAFHKPYVEKYNKLFGDSYENLVIIKGSEGAPEVFNDFKYWVKKDENIVEESIKLLDLGIEYNETYEDLALEGMVEIINNPTPELIKIVKLNVAILLFTTKRVDSINKAYEMLNVKDGNFINFFKKLFS
ncbi:glycosyl transferase [Halarcobacter ebronensis]|uniref:Glycosyl transferase n=1 Tax=Halarcobacter ebronensis TaxID=1462615 RepID=A0A4Q0YEH8_9BACT|nr:glycosyl transferase [Halarcobacter ebronensis]RXJ68927.1 glycosyl transferase [Halarcobacter ebronensis]